MAKSPCTDCIEKYEKTKQRKRKAKQRQKQKAVGSAPSLIAPTPLPVSPYSGLSSRVPPPTNNLADLLAVLRVSEAMKQQQNKPELDSLERTPPSPSPAPSPVARGLNPAGRRRAEPPPAREQPTPIEFIPAPALTPVPVSPAASPSPGPAGEQPTPIPARTLLTASRNSLDIVRNAERVIPPVINFLGGVASSIGRAAAAAAEPEPSLERTPQRLSAEPELQFLSSTERMLGNVIPPVVNFLGDVASSIGRAAEAAAEPEPSLERKPLPAAVSERLRRYLPPPDEETGSRFLDERRRLINMPYVPAPAQYQYGGPPVKAPIIGQPPLLIPETETSEALGSERTVLDLMTRPKIDAPLVPNPDALYPESESLVTPEEEAEFEDAIGEEGGGPVQEEGGSPLAEEGEGAVEPLSEVPSSLETPSSLVTGEAMVEEPLTSSKLAGEAAGEGAAGGGAAEEPPEEGDVGLSEVELQREYDKQKKETERLRKDVERLTKLEEKQRKEEAKAKLDAEKEVKRLERERVKAEKEAKKRVERPTSSQLQIPGVKRSDVANTPTLQTLFGGMSIQKRYEEKQKREAEQQKSAEGGGL